MPGALAMSETLAPFVGVPVQPVMPVNDVAVVPVYEQVPVPPATVNMPVGELNAPVAATLSVPPARFWLAPLTVVVVVEVIVALSSGVPLQPVMPVKDVPVMPV